MAISAKSFAILTTGFRVEGFFFCGSFKIFLSILLAIFAEGHLYFYEVLLKLSQ